MSVLALSPEFNTGNKKDATGAFIPESQAFCALHGGKPHLFNNAMPMRHRFEETLKWLGQATPGVHTLALFCHGYKTGLQCGVMTANAGQFAAALQRVLVPEPRIALYACDAARDADDESLDDVRAGPGGDGGFADVLRDELSKRGVRATIYAHATAGHTTRNPYVRRFDAGELAGGHWVILPHSRLWRPWVRALHGSLRFRFPFLSQAEIERELMPPSCPPSVA